MGFPTHTRIKQVKSGDKLQQYVLDTYDDLNFLIAVATVNLLNSLRYLEEGSEIKLPPVASNSTEQ
ncbi:hypothetical protein [Spartinivicinus poritis]|uniref:LysM domain-containing protein n=1 Tax=Spartinivicinus poritis TaxID=2994640 RepID=A0ABT5UF69_9GAMM|nr:hypothetical protein [Spartinivicinus sp. A2-2]MDE1465026.1 hypothetical protein [Spartinivicinus sp. A2-2]